jgi:hypothetical protein
MSAQEIQKAIAALKAETLKKSIEAFEETKESEKQKLETHYIELVKKISLQNLLAKLKEKDLKSVCDVANVKADSDNAATLKKLEVALPGGISPLLDKSSEDLLKAFSNTLGLEIADKEDMKKQIADEVMLTGMESFLNKLGAPVLKSSCTEMKLDIKGTKNQLVERYVNSYHLISVLYLLLYLICLIYRVLYSLSMLNSASLRRNCL